MVSVADNVLLIKYILMDVIENYDTCQMGFTHIQFCCKVTCSSGLEEKFTGFYISDSSSSE